jgi:hypothetical protein
MKEKCIYDTKSLTRYVIYSSPRQGVRPVRCKTATRGLEARTDCHLQRDSDSGDLGVGQ